jgi:hypothetical protein
VRCGSSSVSSSRRRSASSWCSPPGFALAALTPLSPRYAGARRIYERYGGRIVVADMQLTMASLAFLWLTVVGVI